MQFNTINRINISSVSSIPTSCLAVGPCASKAVHFNFPLLTESQEGDGEETFAIGFPSIETTTFNNIITGIPYSTKQRGTIAGCFVYRKFWCAILNIKFHFARNGVSQ